MDAFYASVEQRDDPSLRGKPIAVGGGGLRGVVAAASYEARRYGVRSAMPSVTAQRLCPSLIFVHHRFEVYKEVSTQIREIFREYTDLVEPLSLDEAYLDVTEPKLGPHSATLIAEAIRAKILARTQLTASAGISYCKFLAKVASDINKPDGMKVILPEEALAFLGELPIEKFHGIGKVTASKLQRMGIRTGAHLRELSEIQLVKRFGKAGRHYYRIVRGQDERPVNPNRIRKSIGAERTFSENLKEVPDMKEKLDYLTETVFNYMKKTHNFGRTVTLKMKTPEFQIFTRSRSFNSEVRKLSELRKVVYTLLEENITEIGAVRLLGMSVSNLEREQEGEGIQLLIEFPDEEE
jgi:DNA polymerase-4